MLNSPTRLLNWQPDRKGAPLTRPRAADRNLTPVRFHYRLSDRKPQAALASFTGVFNAIKTFENMRQRLRWDPRASIPDRD